MNLTKNKKKQIEGIDFLKSYKISDAVKIIKEKKYVKFDESLEVCINTGIDSKQSDQNVRGSFIPPHGLGKKVLIAVFAQGKAAEEAKAAGAKHVGGEDLVAILEKKIDVDVIVATPEIRLKKLRATLSLFKIALGLPYIIATTLPFLIFFPSLAFFFKNDFFI